jgi:Fic family protein
MATQEQWNWQQRDWPEFRFDKAKLEPLEAAFLHAAGLFAGTIRHVGEEDKQRLIIDLISNEAFKTSEIEGEALNRDSLQSSIRRHFGLSADGRKVPPAERGTAGMMVDLYRHYDRTLDSGMLCRWHTLLMSGRRDLEDVGRYRTGREPMQVVSGPLHAPKIHFEAPPGGQVKAQMKRFIQWFNRTAPGGKQSMPALMRAGIAHLYFESIHPFEDGNGRIGRALSEMALSQALGSPTLIALSQTIQSGRKAYYDKLEQSNKHNEITGWLVYFAETILQAQAYTQRIIDFVIAKMKFLDRYRGRFNERQEKAILRLFRAGPEGFEGGLSAEKYINITGASRATATRDLQELVEVKALIRTGERKGTRYYLNPGDIE